MVKSPKLPAQHAPNTVGAEAGADASGERLDRFLAAALSGSSSELAPLSRSRLKALIEQGKVTSNGVTILDPSHRVKSGDRFSVAIPEPEAAQPVPVAMDLAIAYEDKHLIVIDKPAGLTVHPAPGHAEDTLVNALIHHCGDSLSGIGGVKRPGIVHRIDKDTSGLLVVAKNDKAHQALSALFASHDLERAYQAIVWGVPSPLDGLIEGNIGRDPRNRKRMSVRKAGGKEARTNYRVLDILAQGACSLVECRLETGRTHQIRVHMTAIGHPLIGDPLYGRSRLGSARARPMPAAAATAIKAMERQALHARLLAFRHPVSGKELRFESPLPADMAGLLASFAEK